MINYYFQNKANILKHKIESGMYNYRNYNPIQEIQIDCILPMSKLWETYYIDTSSEVGMAYPSFRINSDTTINEQINK